MLVAASAGSPMLQVFFAIDIFQRQIAVVCSPNLMT
jgi:hypothetical protein